MTDKTREDFERWAKRNNRCTNRRQKNIRENRSPGYYSPLTELAWSAYQQGIADARKESTETAAEWIGRHCLEYDLPFFDESDAVRIVFSANEMFSDFTLENEWGFRVSRNITTADDCEMLCKILRVTPVERVVGT